MKPRDIYNEMLNGNQPKVEKAEQAMSNNQSSQPTGQVEHFAISIQLAKGLMKWAYDKSNPAESFYNNKN
jgi:hypothetical protein